ncbi:MAG TPA: mechanosensitive ion channel family protein [Gemmataceae bacterium]|nr:mechanosensitive ion channel family protein [Gemmataceae bacterium]
MPRFLQDLLELLHQHAGRIVGAAVILLVGWLAVRYLIAPLHRLLERSRMDPSTVSFLINTLRSVLIVAVLLGVLQELGVETTSLLALLGAAGLAVVLSLQNFLANFAAGLLLLSYRMVRVGDLVEVGDVRGYVTEMLPFHVVIVTLDNQRVTIPNTTLTNGPVRNHSVLPTHRVQWTLPLTPQDDVARVIEALTVRLKADPRILSEPAPQLFIQDWAADKRTLMVQAWTSTTAHLAVQQELLATLGQTVEAVRRPS